MADMLGILLLLVAPSLFLLMLIQQIRGTHPLLSLRNFAIVGAVVYIVMSPGRALIDDYYGNFNVENPVSTGLEYIALLAIFIFAFNWFYNKGWGTNLLLRKLPVPTLVPSLPLTLVLCFALTVCGFGFRFGFQMVPIIGTVTDKLGMVCAAMACGLIGWMWAPRLLNPLMGAYALFIFGLNSINVLTDYFSRRPLIALGAALIWGMFYSTWRLQPTRKVVGRIALMSIVPVLFVSLYSAARKAQEFDRSAGEQISEMQQASMMEGLWLLFEGQSVGPVSMWLIESYPERFDYRHLLALRCLICMPVPRDFWEGKPEPLSTFIANDASLSGVNQDLVKISPGIIGQSAAEGGVYALLIYALVGALLLRWGDGVAWQHVDKPLAVVAVGASMGDVMGLARGESVLMSFNYMLGVGLAYTTAIVISKLFARAGSAPATDATPMDEYSESLPGAPAASSA